jgi:hypothetical protein
MKLIFKTVINVFVILTMMVSGFAQAKRRKKRKKRKKIVRLQKKEYKNVQGGTHWRIKTKRGALHVWIPKGYNRKTAGTVIFIHGYGTSVDQAWKQFKLAWQFKKSRQNALFIVPEAPKGRGDSVKWNSLRLLKKAVTRANIRLPNGPTVVIGHSGAFRTIIKWVSARFLSQIILLDAMYGGQTFFDKFIAGNSKTSKSHKLVIIASDTAKKSKQFAKKYPRAAIRNSIPSSYGKFTKKQRGSRLIYIHSQFNHSQIVRNGKVIPVILRLTPLKLL